MIKGRWEVWRINIRTGGQDKYKKNNQNNSWKDMYLLMMINTEFGNFKFCKNVPVCLCILGHMSKFPAY